jgi:hypothetical protein
MLSTLHFSDLVQLTALDLIVIMACCFGLGVFITWTLVSPTPSEYAAQHGEDARSLYTRIHREKRQRIFDLLFLLMLTCAIIGSMYWYSRNSTKPQHVNVQAATTNTVATVPQTPRPTVGLFDGPVDYSRVTISLNETKTVYTLTRNISPEFMLKVVVQIASERDANETPSIEEKRQIDLRSGVDNTVIKHKKLFTDLARPQRDVALLDNAYEAVENEFTNNAKASDGLDLMVTSVAVVSASTTQ